MSVTRARRQLLAVRNDDGGFGPAAGAASEPEPTAMAALALDDDSARAWLEAHLWDEGGAGLEAGSVRSDDTAVVALALPPGPARDRALDHIVATFGRNRPEGNAPGESAGWPWTEGTYGWVEPTAWALLALRSLRPEAVDRIDDAMAVLRERECVTGGWNFGTRHVLGVDLQPYVQTTAVAALASAGLDAGMSERALRILRSRWRAEAAGLLTLATATACLQRFGEPDAAEARAALESLVASQQTADTVSLAWALIATGTELGRLQVS